MLLDLAGKARAAGEDTFTYGLMHQRQACQAATMEQALPRFTAAKLRAALVFAGTASASTLGCTSGHCTASCDFFQLA